MGIMKLRPGEFRIRGLTYDTQIDLCRLIDGQVCYCGGGMVRPVEDGREYMVTLPSWKKLTTAEKDALRTINARVETEQESAAWSAEFDRRACNAEASDM